MILSNKLHKKRRRIGWFIHFNWETRSHCNSWIGCVVGAMNNKGAWSFGCRRGLLAYVYNGVSLSTDALVAGNGSYIVRPCGHDLHGPTSPFLRLF